MQDTLILNVKQRDEIGKNLHFCHLTPCTSMPQFDLLEKLTTIHSPTGEEWRMKQFILEYVEANKGSWHFEPQIIADGIQDAVILVFGTPRTAVFAHMDTVGFTARYANQLLPVGSPAIEQSAQVCGEDTLGLISCKAETTESGHLHHDFPRAIERGTSLVYSPNYKEDPTRIKSPYLDNRLGIFIALKLAETLEHGVLVFGGGEEHGGGSAGFLARLLFEKYKISQSLICDVTWVTDGVFAGEGVAVSMRDAFIPRRSYVDRILQLAEKSAQPFQLEVEGTGGSDGSEIHIQPYPIDWCFVGAPILNPHSPVEVVDKRDVLSMLGLYKYLLQHL